MLGAESAKLCLLRVQHGPFSLALGELRIELKEVNDTREKSLVETLRCVKR